MGRSNKRKKILTLFATAFTSMLALALVIASGNISTALFGTKATQNEYTLVLDSSNKVTSAGDHVQKTKLGNDVTFTYTNVASSTSGHVTFNNGGKLVNKDHIRSIQSVNAVFNTANALKFKVSYDGSTTGGETVMESGRTYDLGSNPYYLHLEATASVTLSQLTITYSCVENPNAYEGQDTGEGLLGVIDFWDSSNSDDTGTSTLVNAAYVQERTYDNDTSEKKNIEFVSAVSASYTYQKRYGGIGLSSGNNAASLEISLMTGFEPSSVTIITAIRQTGSRTLTLNDTGKTVNANCTGITELTDTYTTSLTWEFDTAPSKLQFTATSGSKLAIYRIYLYGESGPTIEPPEESIIGFTASDSKASSYYTDDVYDSNNGLLVKAQKTGGTEVTLSKGGADGYSYVVYNSADQVVNTATAFGTEGIYTVVVSYKNFIPVEIQLTVGFKVTLVGIEVVSTNTIFNTAQKLSDYTSGISANLRYNLSSENETVAYSQFASKGLSLTLLNPSDVSYSISSLFGTAGTWKIKVESTSNASVFDTLDVTVNAIPVTGISVTGASATVEEESQLQLTASVVPNNATIQTVTWSSNHESIATVNTNGLVTGVSEGEARITATATDGSQVYGYIDITVTAKPQQSEFDAELTPGSGAMACTVDGNDGVKVGTSKASGTMTFTIGAGATRISFYAAGWAGTGTTLSLTGATLGDSSIEILGDTGISGSGSTYDLDGTESDYYCETTVSNVTSETDITITSSKRFALWKAKYYTTAVEPVYPTSISLTAGSNSVAIGGTTSVEVSYSPADTNVKNVTFSSNATSVATVSSEGIITGVAAGSARITATAEAENSGTVSAYVDITVTAIAVTGVTVSPTSASIAVDATQQLTATVAPSNATNKNVTWSSDTTSVATVSSSGLVTGKAAGTATITVTSAADSTKKATCTITVTASGGGGGTVQADSLTYEFSSKSWAATPANWTSGKDGNGFSNSGVQVTSSYSGANGTSPRSFDAVQSVVVNYCTNASKGAGNIIVSVGSSQIGSQAVTTSGGTTGRDMTFTSDGSKSGNINIEVTCTTNSIYIISCTINYGTSEPTDPTSISISPSSVELAPGGTKDLAVNYTPASANQNKDVTWSRYSGSSNITVSSAGKVTVSSNATAGNTAVIRATLTNISSIYAQCTVTVVEQTQDDQTILLYICGSDLESNGQTSASSAAGYASGDITEILKVGSQPDDVNVVMETGGAKCWKTTHGINKSYLERYHVANKSLVRDSQETKANMGLTSTLQSFLTWGVQNYPADRISLILWNHGGAMRGVCYDENYSSDCLTNSEVKTAVANTFISLGRSTSDKFEWIGYDACLMQVQDIAEFNSQYFNYMVASEESEAGAGWDYDNWLDDAYAKKTTPNILKAICDSFLAEQGSSSDQTLSYLDLSYMSAYKSAWETMSSTINSMISSYGKSNFQTLMKTVQDYGSDSDCEGYSYFGIMDAKDVVNKIRATSAFSGASTQTSAVLTAFTNLVAYSKAGTKAGNSYGLCCFFPMKDGSGYTCNTSSVYTASQTNFTNWRSIVTSYGD